jgi:hypothetical protein
MERRMIEAVQASEARIMAAIAQLAAGDLDSGAIAVNVSAPAPVAVAAPVKPAAPKPAPAPAAPEAQTIDQKLENNLQEIAKEVNSPVAAPKGAAPVMTSTGNITEIDMGDRDSWVEDPNAQGGMAGIMVEKTCAKIYNDVRRTKNGLRWGMFQFDKSCSWIIPVATCLSTDDFGQDWADFAAYLPAGKSVYAVYNFDYEETNGRYSDGASINLKSKMCLFTWSPKACGIKQKMLSATSVKAIKEICKGTIEASMHSPEEAEWEEICSNLRIDAKPVRRATYTC